MVDTGAEEYELVAHDEMQYLRDELRRLKKEANIIPLTHHEDNSAPVQMSRNAAQLHNSIERLNESITRLLMLFERAELDPKSSQAPEMKKLEGQNEQIASGLVQVVTMIRDQQNQLDSLGKLYGNILTRMNKPHPRDMTYKIPPIPPTPPGQPVPTLQQMPMPPEKVPIPLAPKAPLPPPTHQEIPLINSYARENFTPLPSARNPPTWMSKESAIQNQPVSEAQRIRPQPPSTPMMAERSAYNVELPNPRINPIKRFNINTSAEEDHAVAPDLPLPPSPQMSAVHSDIPPPKKGFLSRFIK
ncbi:MAG: hypothetical protein ABIH41_04035 [Nanoarchaeota archaeon]